MSTGSIGWCAPSAARTTATSRATSVSPAPSGLEPQLVGRRDAVGEQRRDVVGLARQGLGVGWPRAASASTPTSSRDRVERAAQRAGSRGADCDASRAPRARAATAAVGPRAQLGDVDRAGGSAGVAGRSAGGQQVGRLPAGGSR